MKDNHQTMSKDNHIKCRNNLATFDGINLFPPNWRNGSLLLVSALCSELAASKCTSQNKNKQEHLSLFCEPLLVPA